MTTRTHYGATSQMQVLPPVGEATEAFLNHEHRFPDYRLKPIYTRLVCHFCDKRWVLVPVPQNLWIGIRADYTWVEYPNNASIAWDDPAFA